MYFPFSGKLSGNGLVDAAITGETENVQDPNSSRETHVLHKLGRFLWNEAHRFQAEEVYRLELDGEPVKDIRVLSVKTGPPDLVKFKTLEP